MCDYSLMSFPNRLAREGEQLVVHRFGTGTLGLVQPPRKIANPTAEKPRSWWRKAIEWLREPNQASPCVVCIPPGARLILRDISGQMQERLGVSGAEIVFFTQIGADQHAHRDAIRFANGREILLQHLNPGQRADVLSLALPEDVEAPPAWSGSVRPGQMMMS